MQTDTKHRKKAAYITAIQAELNGPSGHPFFKARLAKPETAALLEHLADCAARKDPCWFSIISTHEAPTRLRLTEMLRPPKYEEEAAETYLRGDIFRITGQAGSCNIDFSPVGATLLADRIQEELDHACSFIEIRVPSRKRNLVEFLADTDLMSASNPEIDKLSQAGEAIAASLLADSDFTDWEVPDADV